MKNRMWIAISTVVLAICLTGCYSTTNHQVEQDTVDYCYQINKLIKDFDFHTAEVTDAGIVLLDKNFDELETVPFDDYQQHIKILGIHKNGEVIFFVLSGSVDDEQGLMFVNDDSNQILDGLNSIDRVGSNYYYYDTQQSP